MFAVNKYSQTAGHTSNKKKRSFIQLCDDNFMLFYVLELTKYLLCICLSPIATDRKSISHSPEKAN